MAPVTNCGDNQQFSEREVFSSLKQKSLGTIAATLNNRLPPNNIFVSLARPLIYEWGPHGTARSFAWPQAWGVTSMLYADVTAS
jgi:hypothetical protein